jgi:hypothetical protein
MTDIEIWRTAIYDGEIYEGYEVSNLGRVKSLNYKRSGKAKLMKPGDNSKGYLQVELWKNGKPKTCKVHRLVAETFLPNPEGKPQVNHKMEGDEGKTMNFVFFNEDGTVDEERTTIEWCDGEYNINYGTRNERAGKAISKAKTNGKKSKPVLQLSLSGELIREWESTRECGRNGFIQQNVVKCCNGKQKTHKGFSFMYK